ncbi:MAG: glycosyltransferase family 4 protein [Pseudomonadota bacterium]|nr:glycosyltransferase family 4 protein [Pseudomonadota bacterium]
MITTFYPPYHFGGDATYLQALARALVNEGHEVEIVHCTDAYRLKDKRSIELPPPEPGIRVHRLHHGLGALSPLITQQTGHPGLKSGALREILRRDFDVVHYHNISLIGGPAVLGWSHAPVTLYTLHEHWMVCPTHILWKNRNRACDRRTCFSCCLRSGVPPQLWRLTGALQRGLHGIDVLLAPSRYTADRHIEAGLADDVTVLPLFSGIAPGERQAAARIRPLFLFVGRVTASKGIVPLLEQFATLPDYDLMVVGEGDLRAAMALRFATHANIRFLGLVPQSELADLYAAATALVFPSLAPETFGLSVVEAFACGTPAIVRDAGGCREPVDATGGGIVYRKDPEMREAVHRVAGDKPLRDAMGRLARAGYLHHYTTERHVAAYLDIIATVRERAPAAGGSARAGDNHVP